MAWNECDSCGEAHYSEQNPFVELRQRRPSDPSDMCCVMAGHARCLNISVRDLPSIGQDGGAATPKQWEDWIEDDGWLAGYAFLG